MDMDDTLQQFAEEFDEDFHDKLPQIVRKTIYAQT